MGRFLEVINNTKDDFSFSVDNSKNPDQFAADQDLAGQTGLPVDYVERNRADAEKVKKQNVDYSKFADMELGASLTDPAFSNLAQDDLDNLSYLEKTFKGLGTTISESFKQGAKGVALSAIDEGAKPATAGMMPGVYDPFVSDIFEERNPGLMTDVKQAAAGIAIESIKENEAAIKAVTPEGLDVLQQGIRSGAQSLAQMVPGFAASLATRSSAPMLTTMGIQSYGSAYSKARAEGLAPEQAASYGMLDAAVEVATEKLPADKILKITGEFGNQTLRNVMKFMVVEAGTEQVATFLQSLNALAFGLDDELAAAETAADQAKIHAERAAVTLIATVVAGGSQAGIAAGVGKAAEKLSGGKQQLQDMVASAEQSNLKRRSPEQFRSFLQSVDPLANVFVPASAFDGVQLDPSNKTLAQVAAQLPQARALNGDVVIPVADVLTDIPADMFATVAPFVRVEADGVAEIDSRPDMKELIEQVNRESEMATQSKAFQKDLSSQLIATARARPEEATKYAAVVGARLETLAVDKGMTLDEAVKEYIGELRVVGPDADLAGGNVMEQPYTDEETDFFKSQGVLDGEPVTVESSQAGKDAAKAAVNELLSSGAITADHAFRGTTMAELRAIRESGEMQVGRDAEGVPGISAATIGDGQFPVYGAGAGIIIPPEYLAESGRAGETLVDETVDPKLLQYVVDGKVISFDELMQAKQFAQKVPQTETAEFKRWFGDSKVVDESGKPLVVYHGTSGDFSVFDYGRIGEQGRSEGAGFYFTADKDIASGYGKPMEVYLSIEKPLPYDAKPFSKAIIQKIVKRVAELQAEAEGIDISDGFLSNFGDVYSDGVSAVVREAAGLIADDQTALDQLSGMFGSGVSPEHVNRATQEITGHDGVVADGFSNAGESSNRIYVAFFPSQIKSATDNRGTFDPNDPNILNQKERGLISISDKEIVIKLTEASNRSTFLHEAGHLFLEIESRIAAKDGIGDGQRKMLDWLGVESFDQIKVEQHEKFARGFEAYAMEGRAPSKDLVEVFRSFARWLKKVYASMRDLDVELNDDIRQFFDRMLAADQAIKEAERLTQYKALFKDAKTAGMTEQEFADYAANQVRAQVKGGEELQSKLLKELTRQTEKWWKEELAAEKEKAAESLGKEKLYQATAFLTGKTKIEGFDVHKMDLEAVKAMLGVEKKKPEKRYRPEAYVDPRLKRENYRGFLDALVNRDLLSVKEGNLALVVDNTQKGESDSGETKYKRTSSVNPEWFQQFNKENTPVSVDQARIIVKKALAGDRLGVNQARFVVAALDEITGKRSDYADTLRRQREFIREERKRIAEDMPVPEDWISYDEIAKSGEVYKPDQYLADADYIDRSLSEIGYSAILNGVDESVVFDIIDTKSTIEAIESIQKLLKEKADEQGYITQASTGERSDQGMAEEEAGKGGKQREKTGLEKFRGMLAKGGLSPDEVAAMFDFASGQDLVDTIANSPTFNEATASAAKQAMIDKHGDILNDGTLQQEAQLAAHNEERGKLILAELRALTRKVGKEAINRDALKFSAKEVIGRTPLKDIHPGKYRTAEVRSAKEAATALAKKDYAAAAQAKLKQAANFYLYREAMDAKQKEQSWRRYLSAVPNRKYSTKDVHPDYIKQMRLLAAVYDFRRSPDPATLSGIGVWIKAQQEAKDVDIAPTVMDVNLSRAMEATAKGEPVQVKNYREMTLDELQGVYDMVKHLRWVGGQLSENEKVKLQAEYEKVAKSIADHGGEIVEVPREPTNRSRALSGLRQFGQDHLALANQIEELDGFEQFGPAFNLVYQGIIDSSNTELKFRRETSEKVNALFKDFGSSDFAEGKGEETITTEDGRKFTLSRRARVMLALYWGSPDSRAAIESGDGLTTNDVNKMLATLTDKELDLVDSIWKLNESFWPDLARVSKAMTGIVPAKVEHVPFAVNGRVMSGGYMRLFYMYDQRDSVQMVDTEGASITRSGSRIVTQTKHGARHERVGSGGRKVDLNVNNVFRALDEVIHDISFAETARSVTRAMRNPEVSGAIINHYGKEKYESITSSLEGIIAGNVSNSHPINNFIKHFRTAATYGMLGYSLRNAVQQPVALTNMFGRIGEVETIGAMYDFIVNRNKWGKFVQDRSEFMKNRTSLVNREVAEIMGKISGNVMSSGLKQHAFDLQTIGDSMIAYPGWLAAYRKGLKDFGSEQKAIIYADESVSATIGSGLMKDMSPMLQGSGRLAQTVGPEMLKSITFMGSYFNVIGRLIYSATKQADFKSVRGVASYTRTMTWYLAAPAILSALLVGQGPDDDESWLAWSAKAIASYGFATVFMLRDLVSAASGFTPSSAWSRALDASIRASKGVYDVATGEKEGDKEDIAKILRSASYLYPLPGAGQAARTLEYIGSQEAGNEGDFNIYKAIVVGKDRD